MSRNTYSFIGLSESARDTCNKIILSLATIAATQGLDSFITTHDANRVRRWRQEKRQLLAITLAFLALAVLSFFSRKDSSSTAHGDFLLSLGLLVAALILVVHGCATWAYPPLIEDREVTIKRELDILGSLINEKFLNEIVFAGNETGILLYREVQETMRAEGKELPYAL